MSVRRYDVISFDGPRLMANGWLKAEAFIARTGIQEYRRADGSIRRELRTPDEIFHPDALASFAMVPVTDDHPAEGLLDSMNASKYLRGHLGEQVRPDGDKVRASVLITDAELVRKVLDGKTQLSAGYTCDLEEKPGTWNGEPYDCVQVGVRGNHIAVVATGRAGPNVRLKLDAGDATSDGTKTIASARQRAKLDAENAWRQPLQSAYVPYDQSDYRAPEPDPELEARADSQNQPPDPAAARQRMLRASERKWMEPLSAGLRLPR